MSTSRSPATVRADGVRRRPKDRKEQIARVSAQAFSELGYHAVSMENIAAEVGISAAALYRHYSGKYELFRDSVLNLGQQLDDCTADDDDAHAAPGQQFERLVTALVDTTIANRESGGLYRWEGRYLNVDDQARLMDQIGAVNRRLHVPILAVQPGLPSKQKWALSTAVLSVIGSIADHRAKLPAVQIRSLLTQLALNVASAHLPNRAAVAPRQRTPTVDLGKYEALLREAMTLFDTFGYRDTSMDQIAAAVGMPTSGIYRYFSGKSDILAATLRRAADGISAELSTVQAEPAAPREVLTRLAHAYIARSLADPELSNIYYTERVHLAPADAAILHSIQRSTVESWVRLLEQVRSDFTTAQARFVVHAAMALVIDLGRLSGHDAATQPQVQELVELTLFGPDEADPTYRALRTAAPPR